MTSGVGTGNVLITEAFRSALRHQLVIVAAWRQIQVVHVPVAYGSSG